MWSLRWKVWMKVRFLIQQSHNSEINVYNVHWGDISSKSINAISLLSMTVDSFSLHQSVRYVKLSRGSLWPFIILDPRGEEWIAGLLLLFLIVSTTNYVSSRPCWCSPSLLIKSHQQANGINGVIKINVHGASSCWPLTACDGSFGDDLLLHKQLRKISQRGSCSASAVKEPTGKAWQICLGESERSERCQTWSPHRLVFQALFCLYLLEAGAEEGVGLMVRGRGRGATWEICLP